jgi:prevent-host-death family protein
MIKASITKTKNQLSALLDAVRQGETILITDRDVPIAKIEAVAADYAGDWAPELARLERAGVVRRAARSIVADFLSTKPIQPQSGGSALAMLEAERLENR